MNNKIARAAGCFIEFDNKFLILRLHPDDPQGDTWGLVGGNIEIGESRKEAVMREVKEEINFDIDEQKLRFLGEFPLEYPDMTVDFSVFAIKLDHELSLTLEEKEHYDFRWVSVDECYHLTNAMQGLYVVLEQIGAVKQGKIPDSIK